VLWYHPAKGYGFIVSKDIAGDVLLHRSVLEAFGLDAIREGAVLDVDVAQKVWGSQMRSQVKHIHAMLAPDKPLGPAQPLVPPPLGGAIVLDPGVFGTLRGSSVRLVGPPILSPGLSKGFGFVVHDDEDEGDGTDTPWFGGVCKWFSRPKGYGFVALSGSDQDVFVHMEVLRQCGIRELRQGQRVRVQVVHTPKGMIAVEVELA
jgi:CspA family cold shock protein